MANFTDTNNLPKFRGYVQQIPVSDYINAELYKQGKYDKGVTEVQSYLDQLTGLEIDPKYREYLQTSVSSLQEQTKKVSGSDFSNMQLVNQIGSAAKKIVGDKIVQAGVLSNQNLKTQQTNRDQARKDGKSSIENEWDLNDQYSRWSQDSDLANPFNGRFSNYVDLPKKWMEIVKSLDKSGKLQQIPFETFLDANGQLKSTGKIADAMLELGVEGKSKADIMNAINASITNEDINQLSISGRYRFKDLQPEDLLKKATIDYTKSHSTAEQALTSLLAQKKTLSSKDEKMSSIDANIKQLREQLGDGKDLKGLLYVNYQKHLDKIKADPEGAKGTIYADGFISQFSQGFSSEMRTQKYLNSPIRDQQNWFAEHQRDLNNDTWSQNMDLKKLELQENEYKLKKDKQDKEDKNSMENAPGLEGGTATEGTDNAYKTYVDQNVDQQVSIDGQINELARTNAGMGASDNEINTEKANILKAINDYKTGNGEISERLKLKIGNIVTQQARLNGRNNKLQKANKSIDEKIAPRLKEIDNQVSKIPSGTFAGQEFSAKEVMDFIIKVQQSAGKATKLGMLPTPDELKKAREVLSGSEREKILFNEMSKDFNGFMSKTKPLAPYLKEYQNVISSKNTLRNEMFNPLLTKYVTVAANSGANKPEEVKRVFNNLAEFNLLARSENMTNKNYDWEEVEAMISADHPENTRVQVIAKGDKYQILVERKGYKDQYIDAKEKDIERIFGKQFVNKNLATLTDLSLGMGSTDLDGKPENAHYQRPNFTSLKGITATANIEESNTGGYFVNMNVMTPAGWKQVKLDTPIPSIDAVEQNMGKLTDKQVFDKLVEHYPYMKNLYQLNPTNNTIEHKVRNK